MKANFLFMTTRIPGRRFLILACFLFAWTALCFGPQGWLESTWAGTCLDDGCHSKIASARYVHGPVAVESSGQKGCTICHAPGAEPCTATKGGTFTFQHSKDFLCSSCHNKGAGSQHTGAEGKCVSCHNPHSSEVSDRFLK